MTKTAELAAKLRGLDIQEMYENDFFLTWDKSDDEIAAVFAVADALRDLRERNISTKIFDSGLGISNFRDNNGTPAYSLDGTVYVNVAGNTANVTWATNTEGVLNENATAMWQFIPVEGDEPNVFYIQNMGTGLYIGNQSANAFSVTTQTSEEPIPFQVAFAGGDNSYLVSQKDNSNKIGDRKSVV